MDITLLSSKHTLSLVYPYVISTNKIIARNVLTIYFQVDGGWTEFVASGTCSKSCGGGHQTFTRNCTNPSPAHCGKPCEGNSTKVEECNGHGCPGKYFIHFP